MKEVWKMRKQFTTDDYGIAALFGVEMLCMVLCWRGYRARLYIHWLLCLAVQVVQQVLLRSSANKVSAIRDLKPNFFVYTSHTINFYSKNRFSTVSSTLQQKFYDFDDTCVAVYKILKTLLASDLQTSEILNTIPFKYLTKMHFLKNVFKQYAQKLRTC